jgi:pilus assembly protein FimV
MINKIKDKKVMIRKLAIALSLLGVCFAGFVHALGLGEATVKSALNQPLNAEIELVNTAGLSINEILPGLATREEFQRANIDRVYFLSDLRFEVKTNAQGKAVIVLTSKKPVREPYLNFLVELIWPSGRLLREYALLIDPPLFTESVPVKANTVQSSSVSSSGDVLNVPQASGVQKRALLDTSNTIQSSTFGPTTANDTLWDIAIKARPDRSVSPQQVMLAIQDLNPDAFMNGNINKMKTGQVLRLPTVEQIKQRDQYQAIQIVIAQNEAHLGKRSPSVAQGSKSTSSAPKKPTASAQGSDELKLVVADEGSSAMTDSANSGQSNQAGNDSTLAVTLEKLDKATIENKELNSRVGDLEEQLETLQRLLTLKNDQLASMQDQMRSVELARLQGDTEPADQALTEQGAAEAASSAERLTDGAQSGMMQDVAAQTQADEMAEAGKPVDTAAQDLQNPVEDAQPAAETISAAADKSASESSQPKRVQESENIIEKIVNNPLYLSIALLAVLVLVFILWLVSRHNAQKEQEFHANNADALSDDANEPYVVQSNFDNDDYDAYDEEDALESAGDDSSFTEELDEESQDIIAEANAYISYGRMDQAANILEKAISNDPVRTDYRLKLLSVYKDLGDRQAFERQFSELEAIQDQVALKKAASIREEMLDEELVALEDKETELSFNKDDNERDQAKKREESSLESEQEALENDLNAFDFESVSLDEEDDQLDLSSELDLDSLETEDLETVSLDSDSDVDLKDALDLDVESDATAKSAAEDDFDDTILDVDLDDLDLNTELDQETEIDLVSTDEAIPEEDLVVSDDILEEAIQEIEADSDAILDEELGDGDDFDFLSGTDEASTKLDLARAYIDMGDIDGAKDILQEVVKEGSDTQQAEAKELLSSLD